jgi:hypothetical protein
MPASLKRIRGTGGMVFLHTCDAEGCDAEASFGFGVSMRRALECLKAGDIAGAKGRLGKWFCREHKALACQAEQR